MLIIRIRMAEEDECTDCGVLCRSEVTLVCTDVEGSTAMWEWNSAVMQVRQGSPGLLALGIGIRATAVPRSCCEVRCCSCGVLRGTVWNCPFEGARLTPITLVWQHDRMISWGSNWTQ